MKAWGKVLHALPKLPYSDKYREDAWEWTIGRDFKDRLNGMIYLNVVLCEYEYVFDFLLIYCIYAFLHLYMYLCLCFVEVAAFMLELAIKYENEDPAALVTSVYFLEQAVFYEKYQPFNSSMSIGPISGSGELVVTGKPATNLLKNIGTV